MNYQLYTNASDLFGIKLIFLQYELYVATFLICTDATFFAMESFFTSFSLQTQQIAVRLVAIKSAYFSPYVYTTLHFSRTLPLISMLDPFHLGIPARPIRDKTFQSYISQNRKKSLAAYMIYIYIQKVEISTDLFECMSDQNS